MFFFDPMYFLIMIPPLIFMLYAQSKVNSTFKKYSNVLNSQHLTGAAAAERLLRANGLMNVKVEGVQSKLGDHYDPGKKVLRLSPSVANSASVAALGVVAHEVGHAVQDKTGYAFLRFRTSFVPAANLGSTLGYICVILGFIIYMFSRSEFGLTIALIGILLFSLAVIFSLITLPVEYNASNRARQMLQSTGLVSVQELNGASAVLSAAALTYVAATLQAAAQLFYYIMLFMGMRGRD
jgi:Zn-dependent membrane protease YugP